MTVRLIKQSELLFLHELLAFGGIATTKDMKNAGGGPENLQALGTRHL